jgi:RND family efflux transporter MFP subunit
MKPFSVMLALVLVVASSMVWTACGNSDAKPSQNESSKQDQAVPVRVEIIQPRSFIDAIQVAGTVKAYEDVMISPEEGGIVKEWKAQKGHYVKKNEVLALLKDDILQPSYDAAAAQYKLSALNFEKQSKVYSEQAISELQVKSSEYGRDAAKAQAEIMQARLEHTRIKSPMDGMFEDKFREAGEFAPPGVPLVRVVNTAFVKIQAEVSERYSGSVPVGTLAIITFDALPGDTIKAKVSYVSSTVSSANRALITEMVIQNPGRRIKPEMVAKAKLLRQLKANTVLVSENLVQLVDRDRLIVYVENNNRAEERRLKLGGRQGNLVEVVEGLRKGDRLIVAGFQKLVDGQAVNVVQ